MPDACAGFFKRQDKLGPGVSLNYRGSSKYGTVFGGVCSLLASWFFTLFIAMQLYAWAFQPSYSQTSSIGYLDRQQNETYQIPV